MTNTPVERPTPDAPADVARRGSAPNGAHGGPAGFRFIQGARKHLPPAALPLLIVLTFVIFGSISPDQFLTWTNVRTTLTAQSAVLLLAVAVTIPLRAGDLDLSIPAIMVLCASLTGKLSEAGLPLWTVCLSVILIGAFIGAINALFSVYVGLNGVTVSVGLFTAVAGLSFGVGGGQLITSVPPELFDAVNYKILSLPLIVWISWLGAVIVLYVFDFTPMGRYLLFIGGNPSAAALAGVRVARIRSWSFISAAAIAGGTGVLLAGYLGAVDSSSSAAYLIGPATAAFLGTTTIQMGRVNVLGTILGLYFLSFGVAGLQLLGVQGWVSDTFNGVALIFALAFARYFVLRAPARARQAASQ